MKRTAIKITTAIIVYILIALALFLYADRSHVSYTEIVSLIEPYHDDVWTIYFPWYPIKEKQIVECSVTQVEYTINLLSHLLYNNVSSLDKLIEEKDNVDSTRFELTVHNSHDEQVLYICVFYTNSNNYIFLQNKDETLVYKVSEIGTNKRITTFAFDLDYIGSL